MSNLKDMQNFTYSKIGMALVSAQRVEYLTGQLVKLLSEFDQSLYKLTGEEFLAMSKKAKNARLTLGGIFKLLKLNPQFVIEDELNEYLQKRNILVHKFWRDYLKSTSEVDIKSAIDFCYDFGRLSNKVESFFKGFIYFLSLRHVNNRDELNGTIQMWSDDFDYFMARLTSK